MFQCRILILRFTRAANIVSDLSKSKLSDNLKKLVLGAFDANWKGEDPDNFGKKVFGIDENLPFEYVDEYLGYVSCLYLTHSSMEKGQDWVKEDLHPVMARYRESGKNLLSRVLILCSIDVLSL